MAFFLSLIKLKGMIGLIGLFVFVLTYKYSVNIFQWLENQTMGTRTYIIEKLELLFIEINADKITYMLLAVSLGPGCLTLLVFGMFGKWGFGFFLAIVMIFIGFRIPRPFIDFLYERRIKQYQSQMVDALTLLSNGIRAGLSVPQAIGMIVDEMPAPVSQEFNLILQQNRIGVTLEDCFDNLVKRVPTEDNEMFVASVNILRETGGNLAETFDTIVGVIRERIRLQQKVDTYVAQGMFQGMTIFAMPFVIGSIYFASDPKTMMKLFTEPIGLILLILALALDFTGGYFILKIVRIRI